jgi:hypothetical protein
MRFFSNLFGPNIEKLRAQANVEELSKALEDRRLNIQIAAARALGEIGGTRALAPLVHRLRLSEVSKEVRPVALEAVRKIGDIDGLLKILESGDADDRGGAAFALGKLADLRAVEPLVSVLQNAQADETLRGMAALSLAELGDPRAVEPLISVLGDLGAVAVRALGQMGDPRGLRPVIAYFIDRMRSLDMKGFTPNQTIVDGIVERAFRLEAEAIATFGSAAVALLREALDREADTKVRLAIENALRRAEAATGENPVCPKCRTIYNRVAVVRQLKEQSPEMFDFGMRTTKFRCVKCGEEMAISGQAGE